MPCLSGLLVKLLKGIKSNLQYVSKLKGIKETTIFTNLPSYMTITMCPRTHYFPIAINHDHGCLIHKLNVRYTFEHKV